jgi:hypothetical protein
MKRRHSTEKRKLVVSYKNLSDELKEEFHNHYPAGYTEAIIKIDKSPGEFFYAVPFETEDVKYLVKIDVKVDLNQEEEVEEEEFADENMMGDENVDFTEGEEEFEDYEDEPADDSYDESEVEEDDNT